MGVEMWWMDHTVGPHNVGPPSRSARFLSEAAMCGAGQVLGLDIDCEAIESARRSLFLNQARGGLNLQAKIRFQKVPEDPEDAFDFVDSIRVKDL